MILNHNKIAIVGYAKTGKTSLSKLFNDRIVFHSDDWLGSEEHMHAISISTGKRFVVEGVKVLWHLRDYLYSVDLVIRLEPKFEVLPEHKSQRKAIDTVWKQWLAQKPDCRIMIINEDVAEFMIETEKMQAPMMRESFPFDEELD